MAGTSVKRKNSAPYQSDLAQLKASFNLLVADMELVRAALVAVATRLDADAGVTGTTFVSADCAAVDTAAELLAYTVTDVS
jgi:hypothetical protein